MSGGLKLTFGNNSEYRSSECIKEHPILYNMMKHDYKDQIKKDQMLNAIGKKFGEESKCEKKVFILLVFKMFICCAFNS
jgi:hypothetical protein